MAKKKKRCPLCRKDKAPTKANFYRLKSGAWYSYCKECSSVKKQREWAEVKRKRKKKKKKKKAMIVKQSRKLLKEQQREALNKIRELKATHDSIKLAKHMKTLCRGAVKELRLVVFGHVEPAVGMNRLTDIMDGFEELEKALSGDEPEEPIEDRLLEDELLAVEGEL